MRSRIQRHREYGYTEMYSETGMVTSRLKCRQTSLSSQIQTGVHKQMNSGTRGRNRQNRETGNSQAEAGWRVITIRRQHNFKIRVKVKLNKTRSTRLQG